jgi:hypothetical protein
VLANIGQGKQGDKNLGISIIYFDLPWLRALAMFAQRPFGLDSKSGERHGNIVASIIRENSRCCGSNPDRLLAVGHGMWEISFNTN